MTQFFLAIGSFLAAHMLPAYPPVRRQLIAAIGRTPYFVVYALLSTVLLGWVIYAAQAAPSVLLWEPAGWQWKIPAALMPVSLWMLAAGALEANPLSISVRTGNRRPAIASITRHPVLIGFLIWALAHIPPNGDLVAVMLFGSMALLAAAGCVLIDRRKKRELGAAEWTALAQETSVIPCLTFVSRSARLSWSWQMSLAALIAAAIYAWLIYWGHAALLGVSPLPPDGLPLL